MFWLLRAKLALGEERDCWLETAAATEKKAMDTEVDDSPTHSQTEGEKERKRERARESLGIEGEDEREIREKE